MNAKTRLLMETLDARLRDDAATSADHGCAYCQSEIQQRTPSLEKLFDIRALFSERMVYRRADVYTCPRCESSWLNYFSETDSAATMFEEWGHVVRRVLSLDRVDIDTLREAIALQISHDQGSGARNTQEDNTGEEGAILQ